MPWTPPSMAGWYDTASLKRIKDCGFTVVGFVPPNLLDACQDAGLRAIVLDARASGYEWANVDGAKVRSNIASLVGEVGTHPALYGFYLQDEPSASLFSGLATVASVIRELAPGKWPYINLYPDYANSAQLGTTNYLEHIERFIATCKPAILSYDNYSLMEDGSVRDNFWTNLETIRAASRKHGLIFWNIVLSAGHMNYREVTAADLRFQVYSTLAYGGRGLSYFTYFAPPIANYRGAPVDQFGNETPTWQHMRNVNLQVLTLAPTLLQLTSDDVYHLGTIPKGCKGPPEESLVSSVGRGNYVVGEFTHSDGSRYVMIVNKDLARSHPCLPVFRQPTRKVLHLNAYSGRWQPCNGEGVWLAPGQGALLKVEY